MTMHNGSISKVLFMTDGNGKVGVVQHPYDTTFLGIGIPPISIRDNRRLYQTKSPNVSVFQEGVRKIAGSTREETDKIIRGYWITYTSSLLITNLVDSPIDQQCKKLSPYTGIELPVYYRALVAAQQAQEASAPEGELDCLFFRDALLLFANIDNLHLQYNDLNGEEIEERLGRALVYLTNTLAGRKTVEVPYDRLTVVTSELARLEGIERLKLPNLDSAIRACLDFSIPVDLQSLEVELRNGTLKESELVGKLLS